MPAREFVWSELHLPRPLDPARVRQLLARFAADRDALRIAFEVRAEPGQMRCLVGCAATDMPSLTRTLTDLLPGTTLSGLPTSAPRQSVSSAGRVLPRPPRLPLRVDAPLEISRALHSAMASRLHVGEVLVLQVMLGPRRPARTVAKNTPDPTIGLLHTVINGARSADGETRTRLKQRAEEPGFGVTIRLGVAGPDAARRRRHAMSLMSALATAQSPGLSLHLTRERAANLNEARSPWRWPTTLSAPELVGLLGWPLGDEDLPGLPPLHPRLLRAATSIHASRPRVFATATAPGDTRELGVSSQDALFHTALFGPTGSGKSTALLHLITADIQAGLPIVVLDPKKQLIDDILKRVPPERESDVVLLDASEPRPPGFNPLQIGSRDPDVVVDGILAVFAAVFADGWGPRTADIYSACLRTLARASRPEHPATLLDIPRLLTDPVFRRRHVGRVQSDLALAGFWSWYDGLSPAAQANAIAAPLNKLRQLMLRPALVRMLDVPLPRFHVRDVFRQNKILLVPLNQGLIGEGTAALLGSLVIADVWAATQERASEPGANERPGMVYVDEAPRFLHLPVSLADALAQSRSLSVGWHLAAQFRSQFPTDMRTAVDMNARSKIQFATEYDDAKDVARSTPALAPEDLIALDRFHAYVNLVAGGRPTGWASVRTLPPPTVLTDGSFLRRSSLDRYASEPVPTSSRPEVVQSEPAPDTQLDRNPPTPADGSSAPAVRPRAGRKRRLT